MTRKYSDWLKLLKKSNATFVLRHDIDYDIQMARKLMEIERRLGLSSIVYVLPNSPSYSISDIKKLYDDFKDDGFLFGIHIGHSYDNPDPEGAYKDYLNDLKTFEENGIKIHSCVAHYWESRIVPVPKYRNTAIEERSNKENICPSFYTLYGGYKKLSDSAGIIVPNSFVFSLNGNEKYYLQTHPVYYHMEGDEAIFSKSMYDPKASPANFAREIGELRCPSHHRIRKAQDSIKNNKGVTVFLASDWKVPLRNIEVLEWLDQLIVNRHKELLEIVDIGGGIGILGAYIRKYLNVKYTGVDIEKDFIDAGKEMFKYLHLSPNLICSNLYEYCPKGNVLVFLAYEDCWTDYQQLYDVCKNFDQIIITITAVGRFEDGKRRNKKYWYIPFSGFEEIFCQEGEFDIKSHKHFVNDRHLYWLKKRIK
jgi:hypothetical protein